MTVLSTWKSHWGCPTHLHEPADGLLVLRPHGDYILVQPEERPVLFRRWLDVGEDAEKLEEELSSAT